MGQVTAWRAASADPTPVTSLPAAFRAAGRGGVDGPGLLAVLDGMDTAVLAVRTGDDAVLANAAARALFGLPAQRRVTVDDLVEHARVEGLASGVPLRVDDLPVVRALSGVEVGLEVRVVPRAAGRGRRRGPGAPRSGGGAEADGGRRLLLRARPLFGPGTEVVGAVCTAQDLTDLHTRHAVLARRARELAAINEATRAVLQHEDARRAVCEAACRITGAGGAGLFEPDGHGDLVCTVEVGEGPPGLPAAGPSVVAAVFETATAHLLTSDDPACRPAGPAAVWQPVLSHGACRAVLALSFPSGAGVADQLPVVELLAAETSMAIERYQLLRRLRLEASSDGLTGASNRRAWEEELPRALAEAGRTGAPLSLVMLDLDHFKEYNDSFGHPAGDALLRATVAAWRQRLRGGDLLFRYGGEEFVVLLAGCGPAQAMAVAEQLRAVVPGGRTCSAGVVGWDRQESPDALLQRVDEALYRAKQGGRDRAVLSA